MPTHDQQRSGDPQSGGRREPMSWGEVLGLALLMAVVALLVFSGREPQADPVPVGAPLPPLMAEGWLNVGESVPTRESLAGKIVVVDCWATWCIPCRVAMPELTELYAKYQPLGVAFLGLTSETERDRPVIERFIQSVDGFSWPVGYGAMPTLQLLAADFLPTVIVFGPEGQAIWSKNSLDGIEAVLDQALATAVRE